MNSAKRHAKGFTLIASLLLMLLLSGIAIGLMMMVTTEGKVGGTDLQNNVAYHSAEGGIEKMASDLSTTFQNAQSPSATQICNLSTAPYQPSLPGVTWKQYQVTPGALGAACPSTLTTNWGQIIGNGQNKNLWAQIIPVNMMATAAEPGGQEVTMQRSAQVALIPVFQFGVFSEGDLSFFSGASLDFAGPVHTNGDLYPMVTGGNSLTFHSKVSAYGNVVRTQLPNGFASTTTYNGNVFIPTVDGAGGCPSPGTASGTCLQMAATTTTSPYGDGSVIGAGSATAQSGTNYNGTYWTPFSSSTNYEIVNGNFGSKTTPGTGATKLSMPFVNGATLPNEIIRRPLPSDSTALLQSREYSLAQIRVLLSDDPADLPGGAADAGNVRLANVVASNPYGLAMTAGNYPAALGAPPAGKTYNLYFAAGSNAYPDETGCSSATGCPTASTDSTLPSDWPFSPKPQSAGTPNPTLQPVGAPILTGTTGGLINFALCPPAGVPAASQVAGCPTASAPPSPYYVPQAATATWNLLDGWLRVEYRNASGVWSAVTNEWLQLGFARGPVPPTAPGTNPVNPNAILLLQEPADRNGDGVIDSVGLAPVCTSWNAAHTRCLTWNNPTPPEVTGDTSGVTPWQFGVTAAAPVAQSITQYNWYPINFYDAREGEVRDNTVGNNSCSANGLMNAIEIDVGNLKQWLAGATGTNGTSVDSAAQNGYVLYFSDRRGMLFNPNAAASTRTGDAGLEDVVNRSSGLGTPDGTLDPVPAGRTFSPEDVNQNGLLDGWGALNMGLGFWNDATHNLNTAINTPASPDPFGTAGGSSRINTCASSGRKNWVSGARHALRLVDGSLGNIPLSPTPIVVNGVTYNGGFTVAAENPVYIEGDYNTNQADWNGGVDQAGHAAAAVIADAVTLLSVDWSDLNTTVGNPTTLAQRNPSHDGYFRVAIAGGKNMTFQLPTYTVPAAPSRDFGTDGGLHNFLRYLEDWSNQTVHYKGSLVSLYYSTYDTGIFKCCTVVYGVPTRDYIFDTDFSVPAGLPPGTPMFRDVNTLGYRQSFTPRQAGQ